MAKFKLTLSMTYDTSTEGNKFKPETAEDFEIEKIDWSADLIMEALGNGTATIDFEQIEE